MVVTYFINKAQDSLRIRTIHHHPLSNIHTHTSTHSCLKILCFTLNIHGNDCIFLHATSMSKVMEVGTLTEKLSEIISFLL